MDEKIKAAICSLILSILFFVYFAEWIEYGFELFLYEKDSDMPVFVFYLIKDSLMCFIAGLVVFLSSYLVTKIYRLVVSLVIVSPVVLTTIGGRLISMEFTESALILVFAMISLVLGCLAPTFLFKLKVYWSRHT